MMNVRTSVAMLFLASVLAGNAGANELVYVPVNPSFGGNPANGSWLAGEAAAQNLTQDPNQPQPKTELDQFKDQLQRAVLGRVASTVSGALFDDTTRTWILGTQTFGDFRISVQPYGTDQVQVTITDTVGGSTTSFTVSAQL